MKSVSEMLRSADPVTHEPPVSGEDVRRVKRAIVAASAQQAPAPDWSSRGPRLVAAVAVLFAVTLAAMWSTGWLGRHATLQAAVRFEVRLAEITAAPGLVEARIAGSEKILYLHSEPVVTNEDIADARVIARDGGERYDVAVAFTQAGGDKMRQATTDHMGRPLAILIDGDIVVAPTIGAVVGNSALITGQYTKAEADRIAAGMMIR